jgi:hypothetical protein
VIIVDQTWPYFIVDALLGKGINHLRGYNNTYMADFLVICFIDKDLSEVKSLMYCVVDF